jgi:hypothetical protein
MKNKTPVHQVHQLSARRAQVSGFLVHQVHRFSLTCARGA